MRVELEVWTSSAMMARQFATQAVGGEKHALFIVPPR
jgi:hypothetical protein